MKFTKYFLYTRQKSGRDAIKYDWILRAIDTPIHAEIQSDDRIRKWVKIEEVGKYSRVVMLPDGETVHNAFFDRGLKEGEHEHYAYSTASRTVIPHEAAHLFHGKSHSDSTASRTLSASFVES